MLRNPAYIGHLTLRSGRGEVSRPIPPLVDVTLWEAAQASLARNRTLSKKNATREYLLRAPIKCGGCGRTYVGSTLRSRGGAGDERHYYRCAGTLDTSGVVPRDRRCKAKRVPGEWLEREVWTDIRRSVDDPGDALAEAQRQLRERQSQAVGFEGRRRQILQQLSEQDGERERILTLYRKGRISTEEAEGQLDAIAHEAGTLREMLEGLRAQDALIQAQEAHLADAAVMLTRLWGELDEIEWTDDFVRKREIVNLLVRRIVLHTEGEGWQKTASATITYAFAQPKDVVVSSTRTSAERPAGW